VEGMLVATCSSRGWKQNPSPAMPTAVNRACLCRFSHYSAAHGEGRTALPGKMGFLHLAGRRRFVPSGALSLKGCLGWQDSGGGSGFIGRWVCALGLLLHIQLLLQLLLLFS